MHIPTLIGLTASTSLFVDNAPDYVRPYVIEHYARAQAVAVGQQIYRFPVTGKSSGGAFSILSTAAPASGDLGVSPHIHQRHHENFFCLKGGFQLWAYKEGENGNVTQARYFTPGDYASVPRNTTHTFQILSPDTELTGVISPGGFEELFFFLADSNYTASTNSPYVPAPASTNSAGSGSSASILSTLEGFDVYSQPSFIPRRDLVNGSAPTGSGWHTAANTIPDADGIPYFVARDQGPMYLNGQHGWQIIQPFVTAATGGNFTQGSITSKFHLYQNPDLAPITKPIFQCLANKPTLRHLPGT